MPGQDNHKISLEDLLRLKRAERPPAEFWPRFERELRAKQLAALVEKQPWWRTWLPFPAGFSRLVAPLAGVAVLAFAFIAMREDSPTRPMLATVGAPTTTPAVVAVETPPAVSQPMLVATNATTHLAADTGSSHLAENSVEATVPVLPVDHAVAASISESELVVSAGPDASALAAVAFTGILLPDGVGTVTLSPAENSLADILMDTSSLSSSVGFAAMTAANSPIGVELADKSVAGLPAVSQASALRTGFAPAAKRPTESGPASASAIELVSHRLSASEELLYASARRIVDLAGNSVSVRF